jgi:hypothetical protein
MFCEKGRSPWGCSSDYHGDFPRGSRVNVLLLLLLLLQW